MSETLWCVHVYGPDDLLACASRRDAVQNALWLNLSGYEQQNTDDELMPVAWAVPEPWPFDRRSWSDSLAEQDSDDARWTGEEAKLRFLAGELFDFTEDGRPIDWHATVAAEKRDTQELQRRIDVVLAWHTPVESEYRDADGNVTRTVTECAHCSTLADDGIDWPCATASALGAASTEATR